MTRAQRFIEEHGHSTETECASCKRRGNRVIFWSHEGCHECANRSGYAQRLRKQRREAAHKRALARNEPSAVIRDFAMSLGKLYSMQYNGGTREY